MSGELTETIGHHLSANLDPPVAPCFLWAAWRAVRAVRAGNEEQIISLPRTLANGKRHAQAAELVAAWHLDGFVGA